MAPVFVVRDDDRALMIAKAELDACSDLDALITILRARVRDLHERSA